MAAGKEIRTKISSIQNTQKITSAMEMVAASKMRRAQDQIRPAPLPPLLDPADIAVLAARVEQQHGLGQGTARQRIREQRLGKCEEREGP